MASLTNTNAVVRSGNGLGGKTFVVTMGVGGGAISAAQAQGIVTGLGQAGYTIAGVADTFTAASSTSIVIAIQGTATPSTNTGDYFTAATLSITATFTA